MDFGLTQEQVLLADTVRRYLSDNCPTSRVRTVMESESGHDEELWRGLMDLGVGMLAVPESYGGMAGEFLDLALVAEELGYSAAPGPFLGHAMATVALAASGDDELRSRWLPAMASGEVITTVAIGEEGGRWEGSELQSEVRDGKLDGAKPMVPYAGVAQIILVAARDEDGVGLWLVERDGPGVETTALQVNDLTRRLDALALTGVEAVKVGGAEVFEKARDAGLILIAADAYGGSRRCLEMAQSYALEREQFGQVIGAFQAVKHQLANLATEIEPGLSLYWYAAHAFDRMPEQATGHTARHAALAKSHLSDLYDRAARDATELHGGIGFTWEFDLHLWFRRSIFDRSYLGDAIQHRVRAAALAGW